MSEQPVPHSIKVSWPEFYITTAVFLGVGVVAMLLGLTAKKGHRSTVIITACGTMFCFWLMWFCTYAIQINPILQPQITVQEAPKTE